MAFTMLIVDTVAIDDISTIVSIWYKAFCSPDMRRMFPDTPGVRKWWDETIRMDLLEKPQQMYLKVMAEDEIVGYAKWDLCTTVDRYLPWHPDMDQDACNSLTTFTKKERDRVVGNKRYYCRQPVAITRSCD
ncbi:hypothetical protein DRE_04301 [Drechslerella stenobrocha 248]|uniref:N-acetyltransferase domain-containing protein n=1 Tax=Drechslerella stenobrocha 248 TaxID=1043628 RepID=W7I243_9PEZI|nr:hypothetical protein DRE_04301 [Drechslerella stenobrocha 248]